MNEAKTIILNKISKDSVITYADIGSYTFHATLNEIHTDSGVAFTAGPIDTTGEALGHKDIKFIKKWIRRGQRRFAKRFLWKGKYQISTGGLLKKKYDLLDSENKKIVSAGFELGILFGFCEESMIASYISNCDVNK